MVIFLSRLETGFLLKENQFIVFFKYKIIWLEKWVNKKCKKSLFKQIVLETLYIIEPIKLGKNMKLPFNMDPYTFSCKIGKTLKKW